MVGRSSAADTVDPYTVSENGNAAQFEAAGGPGHDRIIIIVVALVAVAAIAVISTSAGGARAQVAAMAHELSGDGSVVARGAAGRAEGSGRNPPCHQGLWRQCGGRQVMARHGHASAQRGQALVAGLVLLAGAVAALVAMHRLGRIIEQRVRLTHAVDAAAYSGALPQARHLNAIAYANRSQIAHQVAMAHLVTRWPRRRATSIARRRRPDAATRLPVCWVICSAPAPAGLSRHAGLPGAEAGLADAGAARRRRAWRTGGCGGGRGPRPDRRARPHHVAGVACQFFWRASGWDAHGRSRRHAAGRSEPARA